MSNLDYILCYREPHKINWDCECDYKSVSEIDKRVKALDTTLTTTFFSYNSNVPLGIKQMFIQNALSPKIIMHAKGSDKPIPPTKSPYKPKGAYF